MIFDMSNTGIRISVVGNDLDVRSDHPLTVPQLNFLKLHKVRLLAELNSGSLGLADILSHIESDTALVGQDSEVIDPEIFINGACQGLPVNSDWVHRYVVDDQDIDDIRNGDLPAKCTYRVSP